MAFKLRHGNAANLMKSSPLYQTPVPKGMVDPVGKGNEDDFVVEGGNQFSTETYAEAKLPTKSGIREEGTPVVPGAMYEGKGNLSKSTGQTRIVSQLTGGVVKDKANPNAKPSLSTDPKKVDVAIGGIHDGKEIKLVDGPKRPTPSGHSGKGYKTGKDSKGKINILSEYGGVPETVSGKESNKGKPVDTKSELVKQNKTVKDQNTAIESGSKSDLALLGADPKKRKVATSSKDNKSTSNKKKSTGVANTKAGDALKGHSLPSEGFEIKPFNPTIGGGSSSKGDGGSSKKQNEGQIGGYLENAIKKGDISLGVDLKMPKMEGTISRATDPGHDIISQNNYGGGRVGRVRRKQEKKTANTAKRVNKRINRMHDNEEIRNIRSTEKGKRREMKESASQERKNLLTDNPVVKDATGGREGSQPGNKSTRTDNAWNPKNTGMPSSSSEVKGSNMTGSTSWGGASNYNKAASAAIDASRAISGGSSSKPKSSSSSSKSKKSDPLTFGKLPTSKKREGTFDYSQSSKTLKKRYK
tara:strand:+ start:431 stop:2011 length:1581 start_codon:yes stop_codon:yes gene_type:complete